MHAAKRILSNFGNLPVRLFKDGGAIVDKNPNISAQRAFVTAMVAKVEKGAPSGGVSLHEVPVDSVEPGFIVEYHDNDCDFEAIMMVEEIEASRLQCKMRASQEKSCSAIVQAFANLLAVFTLTERSLDMECKVTNLELALVKLERKLYAESNAGLPTQHSPSANGGDVRNSCEKLEDFEV